MPSRSSRARALSVVAIAVALSAASCVRHPTIDDAGARFRLFATFGASRLCPVLLERGVRLEGVRGRFFTTRCEVTVDARRALLVVSIEGDGYAFADRTRRVGFTLATTIEDEMGAEETSDRTVLSSRIARVVEPQRFHLDSVDPPDVDVTKAPPGGIAISEVIGRSVAAAARFLVVHRDGLADRFSLGVDAPIDAARSDRVTEDAETLELPAGERDYLGPFDVTESGQALYVLASASGAVALDELVVDRATGDAWREAYQRGLPLAPPAGPILARRTLRPLDASEERFPLPPGKYYVVLDDASRAPTAAEQAPVTSIAARVSIVVQRGN